jgi:hypothetical protein
MSRLSRELHELRPLMAAAAQKVYDEWDQDDDGNDEELGSGGICDQVSAAIGEVISREVSGTEIYDGGQEGDDHAFVITQANGEAFGVDIPPGVYESGGGYNWKRRKDVQILPWHVVIFPVPLQDDDSSS